MPKAAKDAHDGKATKAAPAEKPKEKLTLTEVAEHHHKVAEEKAHHKANKKAERQIARQAHRQKYPYRPYGFFLIILGLILLCFSCIWWAVSSYLVVMPKEDYNSQHILAEYNNPSHACKYLRPELMYNYVGPLAYMTNSTRWQPVGYTLSTGQLYYETCNFQNDEAGLRAGLEIYGFSDSSYANQAWLAHRNAMGAQAVAQPLDSRSRKSFKVGDNKTFYLNGKQVLVISYGPTYSDNGKVVPLDRVSAFTSATMASVDSFQGKE